ncbi:MAG TPA: hypothetical protein DCE07_04545 [Peptococcaceae bacterium]|nr:hypothetical protein [Peptococcaceae bacterium]
MFLELLTIILWVLFGLSVALAVWALVRCAAKMLLVAALPAGVFAFFFFWDPHGRLFFIWPLALLAASASLWRRARWPGWLLLVLGIGACAGNVLLVSHHLKNEVAQPVPGEPAQVAPFDQETEARQVIAGYLRAVARGDAHALEGYVWRYAEAGAGGPPLGGAAAFSVRIW